MNTDIDTIRSLQGIANVLQAQLLELPCAALLDQFKTADLAAHWPRLTDSAAETKGIELLADFLANWQGGESQLIEVQLDYGRLFNGPGTPLAAPWGSVYLSPLGLLNDASTLTLMNFYQAHDIRVDFNRNEPPDHLGLLLAVEGFLLGRMLDDDTGYAASVLTELHHTHVKPWAGRCLALAGEHAQTGLYAGMVMLAEVYFHALEQLLDKRT
ncbi:TorD/DmsD family molecular chaperone [Shewanella sp. GXUN23E]|uniref:TorD/DmsD family molecular chaperone n=1 Tax=Shewanella sp. GXUN23E TaxID=3422498 RepID=UPI003D7DD597